MPARESPSELIASSQSDCQAKALILDGYSVLVEFDPEAKVFVATNSSVPGLVIEAETADELLAELRFAVEALGQAKPAPGVAFVEQREMAVEQMRQSMRAYGKEQTRTKAKAAAFIKRLNAMK